MLPHIFLLSFSETSVSQRFSRGNVTTFQKALLDHFLSEISTAGMDVLTEKDPDRSRHCLWKGFECAKNSTQLTAITVGHFMGGNFQIHSAPPTIHGLKIYYSAQHYAVDTRMLPRQLIELCLNHNRIFGTFDCTTLPEEIQLVNMRANILEGPLNLTFLPRHLKQLNFKSNRISQDTVWYDPRNLPESLTSVDLRFQGFGWIGQAQSSDPDADIDPDRKAGLFRLDAGWWD